MEAESLMVLYADNSVEVHYAAGARLLLSPCGCEYLYEAALPASSHPLQPPETTRQRVAFVLSTYREQLLRALDFRNKFSSRPYLPSSVIPPERKQILFSDILEIRWPDPDTADLTRCADNGSVRISSVDGYAHLYLSELQQEFTVEFLCKVSQSSAASLCSSQKNSNYQTGDQHGKSSRKSVAEMSSVQTGIESKSVHISVGDKDRDPIKSADQKDRVPLLYTNGSCEYTWVTQHWSVSSYPEEWKYPLSLALMCYSSYAAKDVVKTHEQNNPTPVEAGALKDHKTHEAVSHLPTALPLSCRAPHLHRWTFCDFFQNQGTEKYSCPQLIQIVWCQGVLYREKRRCIQILQYCYKTKLSLTYNYYLCCWKMVPESDGREMLPLLLYEKVFPGIGRLHVYSDHIVHAAFWDGITLNLVWDFSSSSSKIQVNEDIGWFKLTTPNGVQKLLQISDPGIYERYIRTAIEWCRSLNERKEIPEYSAHSVTEENWSADAELEKIQRFNFLLDNSNVLERVSAARTNPSVIAVGKTGNRSELEEINEKCVLEALEKTSKVIQDIESLLATSGK
ncbi:uncharacterized protein C5orf34 homolog isoform X2 [Pogoniulus pusillus]|uniref:uncharacterized protein C5orf34 homolog isoform X2 n=1 Tax=Pogoniulus pusillus TaxID=488313 RepID=UPI0030B96E52